MNRDDLRDTVEEAYRSHRDDIWRLCYQCTGSAADADELTQKTFLRLGERPPDDLDRPLRGWLRKVAANLARDRLRRRKADDSTGEWLPAPVGSKALSPEGERSETAASEEPEARIAELERVRYGFLVALEALTADQRSVLLLRDVYDLSVRETAETLEMSESNVKVTHHRARKQLPEDPENSMHVDETPDESTAELLDRLMEAIVDEDRDRLEELFVEDVRLVSDGGDYASATRPLDGRERVLAFLLGLRANGPLPDRWRLVESNAGATLVAEFDDPPPRQAPRTTLQVDTNEHGDVTALYIVMADEKVDYLPE